MNIAIYPLTSRLHDQQAIESATKLFLDSLGISLDALCDDFDSFGSHSLDLLYVRTGGTENISRSCYPGSHNKPSGHSTC